MNDIFSICGIAIISAVFSLILKQYKPEYAFGIVTAFGIFILFNIVLWLNEIFGNMENYFLSSGINTEKYKILFRCFGICMITKIASETCKDCGENSISSKVELAGKSIILLFSIPLFSEIFDVIKILMEI